MKKLLFSLATLIVMSTPALATPPGANLKINGDITPLLAPLMLVIMILLLIMV
ncbi:hypothetical protein ACMHUM_13265 [Proteus mirabilis]|uniref:Fimbrial subunit n=1 Tax=Proteus mirabilis TaxID=584 RepID=A0A2X2DIL7_PROMI|nr:fimbrial subunit [Proteus mirabilis]